MFSQYTTLLRSNVNYRNLWFGAIVSQMGDWFNLIASAALVANITESGTALSYLFLARFLPQFFFSPFAGVFADRYDRRYVMIASDILRAITVLCFLFVREREQIWLFYLLTILQFALSSLFVPARSAVLAMVVDQKELITANALDSITWSTMLAFGAMLGGIATAVFGVETAFVLDAATFLLSAWFIHKIVTPTVIVPDEGEELKIAQGGWLEFTDGLRYLKGEPIILGIALVKSGGSLVWGAINVLEVNYAEKIFPLNVIPAIEGDVLTLTIVYTLSGIGTGIGPILLRRWLGDTPARLLLGILISFLLLFVGIIGLSFAPTLLIFFIWTAIRTVGAGTLWVFSAAVLQMTVPNRVRGRVFAFEFAVLTLTQSISIYWAGFAQDRLALSVQQTTFSLGIVGAIVAAVWLMFYFVAKKHLARDSYLSRLGA